MRRIKIIAYLLFASCFILLHAKGQHRIAGTVVDSATKKGVPYATIVLKNRNIGCYADSTGNFIIPLDSIIYPVAATVSCVGYQPLNINLPSNKAGHIIELSPNASKLPDVEVVQKASDYEGKGPQKVRPQYFFGISNNYPIELASEVKVQGSNFPVRLKSLSIAMKANHGNIPSRLHIYECTPANSPGRELTNRNIFLRDDQVKGRTIHIDLSGDAIILNGKKFFVGIDWPFSLESQEPQKASLLPGITHRQPGANTFTRFVNQNDFAWAKVPKMEGPNFEYGPTLVITCIVGDHK